MKICAIHQPNFFPWLGYFDKIKTADVFIFLDNVAYPKSGSGSGSWVNRVKLLVNKSPAWVGCPIRRESGVQIIKNVLIDDDQSWRKKMLRTLEVNYCKAKNYEQAMQILKPLILYETDNLAQFNMHAIKVLCDNLNIETEFFLHSELQVEGKATDLLVNLIKNIAANAYLCGGGALGYQDDEKFAENDINLVYQNFVPAVYGKQDDFVPGLSVIDYLMKC